MPDTPAAVCCCSHVRRPQTRRRRENDSGAFTRMRNLKANLDMGRAILEWLSRREKRKRDILQCEMDMQVLQLRLRHDSKQVRPCCCLTLCRERVADSAGMPPPTWRSLWRLLRSLMGMATRPRGRPGRRPTTARRRPLGPTASCCSPTPARTATSAGERPHRTGNPRAGELEEVARRLSCTSQPHRRRRSSCCSWSPGCRYVRAWCRHRAAVTQYTLPPA